MRVLLVGSGAREHALAWGLRRSRGLGELHAAPGNPGIGSLADLHDVPADDLPGLVSLARRLRPDLVVVGPEAPLVAGLVDELGSLGVRSFGPQAGAARIEGSKRFAKDVLRAADVPCASELAEARAPCVVKADGLAAGKGVFVCRTEEELADGLARARRLGDRVVVEELLEGEEVSLFALCDGERALALAAARDYKRAGDGDLGPNTGGMGALTPVPALSPAEVEELVAAIHAPVLAELRRRGAPFSGLLYAGLMLTSEGPAVLEFNCRFGDPETQAVVPCLEGDLLDALAAAAAGDVRGIALRSERAAVTIVLAAQAYPESGDAGTPVGGVAAAEQAGALVFHAGTAVDAGGRLRTAGGRVLAVTGTGSRLEDARAAAYAGAAAIDCPALRFRADIAAEAARVAV